MRVLLAGAEPHVNHRERVDLVVVRKMHARADDDRVVRVKREVGHGLQVRERQPRDSEELTPQLRVERAVHETVGPKLKCRHGEDTARLEVIFGAGTTHRLPLRIHHRANPSRDVAEALADVDVELDILRDHVNARGHLARQIVGHFDRRRGRFRPGLICRRGGSAHQPSGEEKGPGARAPVQPEGIHTVILA